MLIGQGITIGKGIQVQKFKQNTQHIKQDLDINI